MSEDETVMLVVFGALGAMVWLTWYVRLALVTPLASRRGARTSLFVSPAVCAAALYLVLRKFASLDVREDFRYIGFYMAMGLGWVGLLALAFPLLGVSARDDVAERDNVGAGHAVSGALLGATLSFAGGNIGNGPGWWVVVFCVALSGGTWLLLWSLYERYASASEAITIERDEAAGVRLGGYLVASGLVLGRGVAGDWVSVGATVADFAGVAWPAVLLTAAAAIADRSLAPSRDEPQKPVVSAGVVPAAMYIAAAAVYVYLLGSW